MGTYVSKKINLFEGDIIVLTDLRRRTGKELGILAGDDLSSFHTFSEIATSSSAMDAVANSETAMNAVANSETAMNAVANSETARNAVYNSTIAWNIVSTNNMAIGKLVAGFAGLNPANYADIDAVANSETAMNAVATSSSAMNAVANSETAMNAVATSETAMNAVANSETAMDKVVASSVAVDKIIHSAIALYYICVNNPQGKGLAKLASNIEGTTTVKWEDDTKWQTIYDTLDSASDLFNKSYYEDTCHSCTKNRQGNLITLVTKCYSTAKSAYYYMLGITPRYSGCYSHIYDWGWSTGKHIMWGGHSSHHDQSDSSSCVVKHYMFTPK